MFGGCPRAFGYLATPVASAIFASDLTCHMLRRHVRTGKTHRLVDGKGSRAPFSRKAIWKRLQKDRTCLGAKSANKLLIQLVRPRPGCESCRRAPHVLCFTRSRM